VTIPTLKKLSAEREHLVFMLWGAPAKSFEHILDQRRHWSLKRGIRRDVVNRLSRVWSFPQSQQLPQQARHRANHLDACESRFLIRRFRVEASIQSFHQRTLRPLPAIPLA